MEKKNRRNINKKAKDELPFAVFICQKAVNNKESDYKQIVTDIISDRIQEIFK